MSIVEKAIQKMRETQQPTRVRVPEAVFGTVVSTGTHRALESGVVRTLDAGKAHAPAAAPPERFIVIDQGGLRAAGLLPPEHQERQIAEQYRQIKRPLIAHAIDRGEAPLPNGNMIMMASAMPGEGKTFTSINLAFSIAREKDVRVLLVDVDVAKPHISKLFGVDADLGLLDVLKDPSLDVESLILPTDVPGLSVLPAGRRAENTTELLASDRMRAVVARIGARDPQRIVLFDSPPLLLTTESQALAEVVGQIVVVVRAGYTSQQMVLDALSYLEGRPVALILNQSMATAPTGYYYYGYGESGNAPESSG